MEVFYMGVSLYIYIHGHMGEYRCTYYLMHCFISEADMESDVMMIPVVDRVRTSTATKRSTSLVIASNRIFDFRWNDLIKKTKKIPQQSSTDDV